MPDKNLLTPLLIIAVAFTMALCSCSRTDSTELEQLDRQANLSMSSYAKKDLDSIATILLQKARETGNRKYEGKAHFYLSSFHLMLPDSIVQSKLHHLETAKEIAEKIDNDTLLCHIYNQMGVWEMGQFNNPSTAQYWFNRSIEKGRDLGKRAYTIPAEMNMSEACRILGDTLGIRYDLDLFEYAKTKKEPLLRFVSGMHCASYYAPLVNDTSTLRPYINAMRQMENDYPGATEWIYATYFFHKGNFAEAERHIIKSNPDNYSDFQVLHARILNRLGRFKESEQILDKIHPGQVFISPSVRGIALKLRASNMASLKEFREAFQRQKEYEHYRDSVDEAKSLDLMKRYKTEYEVAVKDREILEQKMRIRNLALGITAIAIFIIAAIVAYTFWHRRRNRFYQDIVRQNRDFIERQNLLTERLARRDERIKELEENKKNETIEPTDANSGEETSTPHTFSRVSDEKAEEIFDRIQHLADNDQVWRDVNITRDTFSEMVGCNRTYFTDVLKAKTGMNYSQYMNSCRVREAVRVLSDPKDDTPLKELSENLGFLTIQTFYTSFKKDIGMSPAAFRKSARTV